MNVTVDLRSKSNSSLDDIRDGLFGNMGIDGLYARRDRYEKVVDALSSLITSHRAPEAEVFRFPPVMSRQDLQKAGYLKSFPHLLGCVCCLAGSETEVRGALDSIGADGDMTPFLTGADLVLTPAACYPVYPIAAARGPIGPSGLLFDVACDCFRREPSQQLDRMQSFRMREFVRIGSAEQVSAFRETWMARAADIAHSLGLKTTIETASDPFFGRGGQLTAISQMQQSLKFELLVPIRSAEDPTACMSFNYHRSHFGETWGLRDEAGAVLHTGCVAFGMDRLAVALFAAHGLDTAEWPPKAQDALGL
ncbi:MAG TPA: amino acid--[acyl-carrier-protein] ligase [Beijerinckiaceae bacterium]|nr:amino acid--[acyl-carrier-protein] ligase [Beijerinckiaceae bacterium]